MNKMWDTCHVMVQPKWIFGGKNMRILMFSHGIRIGITIPGFLTRVYNVPNKRKSFTLLICIFYQNSFSIVTLETLAAHMHLLRQINKSSSANP
ncbi:hypothetical protein Hanom_Chr14g01246641 [Helianthus anomalus]